MASAESSAPDLYESDYYAWIQGQVRALRQRRIEEIDWANVAEEIEDLGKSEKRSVESHIARIVEHFLKLNYLPRRMKSLNRRGWAISLREARRQLHRLLSESPSLRRKTRELFPHAYQGGRNAVLIAINVPESALPETSPWTLEEVLDDRFLPNGADLGRTNK
jgi:hypothetical protein